MPSCDCQFKCFLPCISKPSRAVGMAARSANRSCPIISCYAIELAVSGLKPETTNNMHDYFSTVLSQRLSIVVLSIHPQKTIYLQSTVAATATVPIPCHSLTPLDHQYSHSTPSPHPPSTESRSQLSSYSSPPSPQDSLSSHPPQTHKSATRYSPTPSPSPS